MSISNTIRYYKPELKKIALLALSLTAIVLVITCRDAILDNLFSEKGMTILMGATVAGVCGAVVRLYYNVIIVRYGRRDRKH